MEILPTQPVGGQHFVELTPGTDVKSLDCRDLGYLHEASHARELPLEMLRPSGDDGSRDAGEWAVLE